MTEGSSVEIDLKRSFPASISNDALLDLFDQIAVKEGFRLSKRSLDCSIVSRQPGSSILSYMMMSGTTSVGLVLVRAQITLHQPEDYKLLLVVGPRSSAVRRLFSQLEGGIKEMSHFWTAQLNDTLDISSPEQAESSHSSTKADVAAYLYFYKMLVNTKYSLAEDCQLFCEEILEHLASPALDEAALGSIARSVTLQHKFLAKKIVESFATVKHPSSFLSEVLLPRAEFATEKFLQHKVGYMIFRKYVETSAEISRKLVKNVAEFVQDKSEKELKEWSGIRDEYMSFKFTLAIDHLNRLGMEIIHHMNTFTLLEKILEFVNILKIAILDESKGEAELVAMDDLAPAFLFVVLCASDFHPVALPSSKAATDALDENMRLSSEGRAVALLDGALRIITDTKFVV